MTNEIVPMDLCRKLGRHGYTKLRELINASIDTFPLRIGKSDGRFVVFLRPFVCDLTPYLGITPHLPMVLM